MDMYDVIVIGTGAGGGMTIKTLCEAGLKVCALNAGRQLDPAKDFRMHKQPYDLKFRSFDSPARRRISIGYMDSEYVSPDVWEHEIAYSTAPGTSWTWPRCNGVGGKTNFWGRSSARMGDIDFKAASRDGYDVDWPVSYADIAPYYTRVEEFIGVASTVQNRPSNPDGKYIPAFKFRCMDYIIEAGAKKSAIPYLPDRTAQLTEAYNDHPACHYCGNCTEGCDVGAFFSSPYFLLPKAHETGNLDLRTNAIARQILVDEEGRAKGVAYVERITQREVEVYAKAVVVAASCVSTAQILLNSRSRQWPTGIANSSGQLGRNLCDHLYGTAGYGYLPQLLGQPSFPDNVSQATIAWLPRWQNLDNPKQEKFIRGYSIYPGGGCDIFPSYAEDIEGFGASYRAEIKRRYPTPVNFTTQAPTQRSDKNFVDIDPEKTDIFGTPQVRIHFEWDDNTLKMWEHSRQSCEEIFHNMGGVFEGHGEPQSPGWSLHETGTCRMGNDPKNFVTNRFGQAHDVPNLYCADASVFLNCTDKTTTLSVLAFSLRTAEYIVQQFKAGQHRSVAPSEG
jgi:choline dehydrogenase-like flavoprotein